MCVCVCVCLCVCVRVCFFFFLDQAETCVPILSIHAHVYQ